MCIVKDLPVQITPHLNTVMRRLECGKKYEWLSSIKAQCMPSLEEKNVKDCELVDPLGAHWYQITPRLVHQYKNRCLLLTTGRCFSYCRQCFRRDFTANKEDFISKKEIYSVCEYLRNHSEVEEILLSGGDPLTGSDEKLEELFIALRNARPNILIRLGTRGPVFAPERFSDNFLSICKKYRPLWIIPHINHPAEISKEFSPETYSVLSKIVDSGIGVQTQTVLMRGVNDSVQILKELFHALTLLGIKPGYLFQGDLAAGTAHFRVNIEEGVMLYEKLKHELSGLSTPVYAVDLPGGGGKINLLQLNSDLLDISVKKDASLYKFVDREGNEWSYPIESV